MASSPDIDFQFLAEHSADVICRVSLNSIIHYASPSCLNVLGWTPEEMIGIGPAQVVIPEDLHIIAAAAKRSHLPGVRSSPSTVRARRKDGAVIWLEINASIVRDHVTDQPLEAILSMRDITERKLLEEKLASQALTDGLTGLANRRAFDDALDKEWRRTLREGSQMSLLILDIDHFKSLNDHYGHQFGDDCLRAIASAVQGVARRAIDLVARYGGEEIAVILPCTDAEGAIIIAERVRTAVEDLRIPRPGDDRHAEGFVTASIGVATALARHGGMVKMPESLLITADSALYRAKHSGRNRVVDQLLLTSQDIPQMAC
jgi:diguanylate cyclase (GGDEF)-like protein/PAS domain S-box-containing protein